MLSRQEDKAMRISLGKPAAPPGAPPQPCPGRGRGSASPHCPHRPVPGADGGRSRPSAPSAASRVSHPAGWSLGSTLPPTRAFPGSGCSTAVSPRSQRCPGLAELPRHLQGYRMAFCAPVAASRGQLQRGLPRRELTHPVRGPALQQCSRAASRSGDTQAAWTCPVPAGLPTHTRLSPPHRAGSGASPQRDPPRGGLCARTNPRAALLPPSDQHR